MAKNKLTKKHMELVDRLKYAGVDRAVALTLVFVAGKDDAIRTEIEAATGLKQPEVSIATSYMRDEGWMDKKDRKKEGKGRPVHVYRLSKPFDNILRDIKENERARIKEMEENLKKIEELAGSIY